MRRSNALHPLIIPLLVYLKHSHCRSQRRVPLTHDLARGDQPAEALLVREGVAGTDASSVEKRIPVLIECTFRANLCGRPSLRCPSLPVEKRVKKAKKRPKKDGERGGRAFTIYQRKKELAECGHQEKRKGFETAFFLGRLPTSPAAERPELRLGPRSFDLLLHPLLEPGLVRQRGVHVHAIEAPGHHGQQEDHCRQQAREPKGVI